MVSLQYSVIESKMYGSSFCKIEMSENIFNNQRTFGLPREKLPEVGQRDK